MKRSEAIRLVSGLMAAYRAGAAIPEATLDAYVEDLADLDYQAAAAAVCQLRQTSKWLPSIAEVRQAAAELVTGHLPDEAEAWAEVAAQIRAVGWCGTPSFSHPAISQAVEAMGWRELCASTNPVADRAHFLQLYRTGRGRLDRERAVSPEVRALAAAVAAAHELPAPPANVRPLRPLGRSGVPAPPPPSPPPPAARAALAALAGRAARPPAAPPPRRYSAEEFAAAARALGLSEAELRGTPTTTQEAPA